MACRAEKVGSLQASPSSHSQQFDSPLAASGLMRGPQSRHSGPLRAGARGPCVFLRAPAEATAAAYRYRPCGPSMHAKAGTGTCASTFEHLQIGMPLPFLSGREICRALTLSSRPPDLYRPRCSAWPLAGCEARFWILLGWRRSRS